MKHRGLEYDFEIFDYGVKLIRYKGTQKSVVIPETYPPSSNLKVVELGNVFAHNKYIETVYISNNVTTVSNYCFYDCAKLKDIYPFWIEGHAFSHCYSLSSIRWPKNILRIHIGTFACCEGLRNIEIPDGITHIEPEVFIGCCNLTSINIPECVTYLGMRAFYGCTNLNCVTIPKK